MNNEQQKREEEIGALWIKQGRHGGDEFLSGTVNGQRIVVFRAQKRHPKAPDWRIFPARERTDEEAF